MPVIFHLLNGTAVATRGERLGMFKRMAYAIGFPIRVKSYMADDRYSIRPKATSHIQEITDAAAQARKKAHDEKPKEKTQPKPLIPSGK